MTGTLDSAAALVVTSSGLASVDLVANAINGTLALPGVGAGSGVVGGPNGLFYVNAQGVLYVPILTAASLLYEAKTIGRDDAKSIWDCIQPKDQPWLLPSMEAAR